MDEETQEESAAGEADSPGGDSAGPQRSTLELVRERSVLVVLGLAVVSAGIFFLVELNLVLAVVTMVVALALLVTSADQFLVGAKGIARRMGIAEIIIGLTIVSIGTSLPEIAVTTVASIQANRTNNPGLTDFALAAVYGSVLVQITLILGIVVLFSPMSVKPSWLRRDGFLMLGATLALTLLILGDKQLLPWEGLLLCLLYAFYIVYMVLHREDIRQEELDDLQRDVSSLEVSETADDDWSTSAFAVMFFFGLGLAIWASNQMVQAAVVIATELSIPEAVIGVTIAAVGTSLPELTVGIMAARKSRGVAIGTLVGSNITDPLLSIGFAALWNPDGISISSDGESLILYWIIPATLFCVALTLVFMWTDFKFVRWEGAFLVGCYVVFTIVLLILMANNF